MDEAVKDLDKNIDVLYDKVKNMPKSKRSVKRKKNEFYKGRMVYTGPQGGKFILKYEERLYLKDYQKKLITNKK